MSIGPSTAAPAAAAPAAAPVPNQAGYTAAVALEDTRWQSQLVSLQATSASAQAASQAARQAIDAGYQAHQQNLLAAATANNIPITHHHGFGFGGGLGF